MNFKEYQYEAALKVLGEKGEIPIKTSELKSLKDELHELKTNLEDKLEKAIKAEKVSSQQALHAALKNSELTHKAETAGILAISKQKEQEVVVLQSTIDNLKQEISAQRELTKSVAEAGKAGAISQSFGKQ